jgi:molecular chaperone DnaK (HSP70)
MSEKEIVVGIDLGTTNSEIAAFVGDRVRVLGPGNKILPSCVGFSPNGDLLVGQSARNQYLIFPDRTIRSIKRRMGTQEPVTLMGKTFTPQEISALILRELVQWAGQELNQPIHKAVITVPAYFSDAQRNATREAGTLAGLEVVRILNEPTAASLAYGFDERVRKTVLVYDLGGGTFDVSIVCVENDVTEVLASHGNTHLGGDDFDQLLVDRLIDTFRDQEGIDLQTGHPVALARLYHAAEAAKIQLSFEPYTTVREENLVTLDGKPLHLEMEISRDDYEELIRPLIESTLDSVSKAMSDAHKQPDQLDGVLLVGGTTRTPLVWKVLEEKTGIKPRQDVHPDLAVALGSGVLASRLAGQTVKKVLVDVSPYSFGPSYIGEKDGMDYLYCYHPIIEKNTPLPVTRSDRYWTSSPHQDAVEVEIFQGDDPDALKNIPLGHFRIEGLTKIYEPNEVLCRMSLDIDGILHVSAIEKKTGKSKHITISNSLQVKSEAELSTARARLQELYANRDLTDLEDFKEESPDDVIDAELVSEMDKSSPSTPCDKAIKFDFEWERETQDAQKLLARSRSVLDSVPAEDREELVNRNEQIMGYLAHKDRNGLHQAVEDLKELLFFIEGK